MTDQAQSLGRDSADPMITIQVNVREHTLMVRALSHAARTLSTWPGPEGDEYARLRDDVADVQLSPSETEPRDTTGDTYVA